MDLAESQKCAVGIHQGVSLVVSYMRERVDPLIDGLIRPSKRQLYLCGLYLLAKARMQTLQKFDAAYDVPFIQSCIRSLLETTVDMALLHRDRSRQSLRKILHWDRSQKFKAAEILVQFYNKAGEPVPDQYQEIANFYQKKKNRIYKMRKKLWGENRHPERWTGSRNLLFDIEEVDRFLGAVIKARMGKTLKEFYETEYRRLNWYIHGSGVAGYWNMPTRVFNLLCAAGYNMACDFGMLCVRIILTDYGFTSHLPDLENEWRKVRVARGVAFLERNSQFPSRETRHAFEVAKQILYPDSQRID